VQIVLLNVDPAHYTYKVEAPSTTKLAYLNVSLYFT
jgi:hypothetical protein